MLNKLCKVLFINLFLVTLQSYAEPLPLPPALPNLELNTKNTEVSSDSGSSIFNKFKQFFSKSLKKAPLPQPQTQQKDQEESKLASQEPNENDASKPFMDVGSTPLPSAANASNANLVSNSNVPNTKSSLQTSENEASEPFIDVGSIPLPSVANASNANLASNSNVPNTKSSPQTSENEASEPFIDVGSTPLPSVANNDLPDNDSTNLANLQLPVTPNVPRTRVTMPPLPTGSYAVPATPARIYETPTLPDMHKPTPLTPPPNANEEQSNVTSPATPNNVPTPTVSPPTPTTPAIPTPVVDSPTTPNNVPTPAVVPASAVTPPTPNMPPVTTPVDNLPAAPITTPLTPPATPNTPAVPTTTDFSSEIDNSKQTFTASVNSLKKQDWNTPLKPVEVLAAGQSQSSNNNVSPPANQPQPQNTSSSNVVVKKQDNNVNNEVTKSAAKFAKDESQVLLLPSDDIVLGKLTEQATLEQMDIYSYIKLFQKKEEWVANAGRRKAVDSLVKYDDNLNKKKDIYTNLSYCSAVDNAFKAIDRDNLSKLRALLDAYPILQEKNRSGDTLLTAATYKDNYYLAKYLVIRGIKISTLNSECQYPLDIALARGNDNTACMLTKAKGYN